MYGIPGEDEYWERVREEYENPLRRRRDDDEPVYENDNLFLDEEIEDIEKEYGCSMQELPEGDLIDLVERFTKTEAISAEWDEQFCCIEYQYEYEEAS